MTVQVDSNNSIQPISSANSNRPRMALENKKKIGIIAGICAVSLIAVVGILILLMNRDSCDNVQPNTMMNSYNEQPSQPSQLSSTTPHNKLQMAVPVLLAKNTIIHAWIKAPSAAQNASLTLRCLQNCSEQYEIATTAQMIEFEFFEHKSKLEGPAELIWMSQNTIVSYIYAYEPEVVMETGIRPLYIEASTKTPPVPTGYHFRPPLGWLNDPNGFSKVGDHYHLFYQHYPHFQRWYSMHWGHAVSKDLINWVHLPMFLHPNPIVSLEREGKGGAFSGSAIPLPLGNGQFSTKSLRVFYTDDMTGRIPPEVQHTAVSIDGIHVAGRSELIPIYPPANMELTGDFRDPNVFFGPDGRWHMVLGSKDAKGGVILLYGTDDPLAGTGWHFESVLRKDDRYNMTVAECSGLVPVGGGPLDKQTLWALIYDQLSAVDPYTGRGNLLPVVVGTFDGTHFEELFEQDLDFGTSAYAFQAFHSSADGAIGIGWLANWLDWDQVHQADFPSAMTLPRRMLLSSDRKELLTPPVENVALLRETILDGERFKLGQTIALPSGTAEILITLSPYVNVQVPTILLEFGHPKYKTGVKLSADGLEILPGASIPDRNQRLLARKAYPTQLRVFLDVGSIEVFADNGRWVGTHRLYGFDKFTDVKLIGDINYVNHVDIWTLKPAELRGHDVV